MAQQKIYGLYAVSVSDVVYSGAPGTLPGAATMSAGILVNLQAVDPGANPKFGNFAGGNSGWQISLAPGSTPGAINVSVDTDAYTVTLPVYTALQKWLLVTMTKTGTTVTVYINGAVAFAVTNVGVVITPQVLAPTLTIPAAAKAVVSVAFYTEQALTAVQVASLAAETQFSTLTNTGILDHVYNAERSMRPVFTATDTFADTGTLPVVPLTTPAGGFGAVIQSDFAATVAPLVTPTSA